MFMKNGSKCWWRVQYFICIVSLVKLSFLELMLVTYICARTHTHTRPRENWFWTLPHVIFEVTLQRLLMVFVGSPPFCYKDKITALLNLDFKFGLNWLSWSGFLKLTSLLCSVRWQEELQHWKEGRITFEDTQHCGDNLMSSLVLSALK